MEENETENDYEQGVERQYTRRSFAFYAAVVILVALIKAPAIIAALQGH